MRSGNLVKKFHEVFNHPIEEKPIIPSEERVKLRIALLREELDELEKAANEGDIVEVTDALCDLEYVLSGAILEFGLHDVFDTAFDQVHESNMTKALRTEDEAIEEQRKYAQNGVEVFIDTIQLSSGECFAVLKRVSDGKIMKPSKYKAVKLDWVKDVK